MYPSSQKGGTLIADAVLDLETHERLLRDPDAYRPASCPKCGHLRLHVHDYRERQLRGDHEAPATTVVRHDCPHCGACWQILPAFIARHLWRSWRVVERSTIGPVEPHRRQVPMRTRQRWLERLQSSARLVLQVLVSAVVSGSRLLGLLASLGLDSTREQFVLAFATTAKLERAHRLEVPASLLHRLAPGVRLM